MIGPAPQPERVPQSRNPHAYRLAILRREWKRTNLDMGDKERLQQCQIGASQFELKKHDDYWGQATQRMSREMAPYLPKFFEDNSRLTAGQLSELAVKLSPGGTHNSGTLVKLARELLVDPDPSLVASLLYHCWGGGKLGFQFLPDPTDTFDDDYCDQAADLIDALRTGTNNDPGRILIGEDRAFYEGLPDRFRVYRGCSGISPELAGAGVCWTTQREIAEWFACRLRIAEPVLVTGVATKRDVVLALAAEAEVVLRPAGVRHLVCPSHSKKWRPTRPG